MEENAKEPWTAVILNKTRNHNERWRILGGAGMGYCHEPEGSPVRLFRIAKGVKRNRYINKRKLYYDGNYTNEMSLLYFFERNDINVPLLVRKNARDWLVANGYTEWLKSKNLLVIEK